MNGLQALEKVKQNVEANHDRSCNYDLILMDLNMPLLDGYDATKQIRDYLHSKGLIQPVIIAVTGHIGDSYFEKAYSNGINAMSPKPVDQVLLCDVLRSLQY